MRRPTTLLLACLAMGCTAAPGDTAPPWDYDFSAFDEALDAFLVSWGLDGATAVVVDREHGAVHLQAYGDHELDRISLIASSSKVMSAGVLVALAEEGALDLDASIAEALAPWGEHKADITTAQLLSNSSGMVGLEDDPTYLPYLCQYADSAELADCAEAIYTADDEEDRVEPDTRYRYGGAAWHLAGGIAQQVSGEGWDQLIERIYVEPCGLEHTGYANHYTEAFAEGGIDAAFEYPTFFDGDLDDLPSTDNPNIEGGAYTTAHDYGRILEIQLRDGRCGDTRVLSAEGVERMQRDRIGPVYSGDSGLLGFQGYGLGWFVDRNQARVADPGAFGAMPWVDLDRGYGVMIILERRYTDGMRAYEAVLPSLEVLFPEES
jgi:CubicO group peptidase (beta-lactamase class C family)